MSTKVIKYISVCLLVLAFGAFGTGVAKAALTANATALTSDGVLTVTGLAASVWSLTTDTAAEDLTVGITGATDSSLILSSTGTGADAMQITTSAGGLDISVTGNLAGEDLDITAAGVATEIRIATASTEADAFRLNASAGGIDIDAANSTLNITNTGDGAGDDLTIAAAGAFDVNLILSSTGTAADALQITTTAGGLDISVTGNLAGEDLDITAVGTTTELRLTSASTEVDAINLNASAGGVTLIGALATADAININASNAAGGIDVDFGTGNFVLTGTGVSADITVDGDLISIDGTGTSNVTVTADAGAEDFTVALAGAVDASLILSSTGTGADAMQITTTAGGLDISVTGNLAGEDLDITTVGVATELRLTSASTEVDAINLNASAGGVTLIGALATADAININASNAAGGIDVDFGTGNFVLTGTGVSADITVDGDLISIDGTGTSNVTVTADAGAEDFTVALAGAVDASLILSSTGTGADAMQITTTAGGLDISVTGNLAGEDLDITAVGVDTEIRVTTASTQVDAFRLNATAGGIDIDAANSTLNITNTGDGAGDDLTVAAAGAFDVNLILSSTGTAADAMQITTTAGGLDISVTGNLAGEDLDITTVGAATEMRFSSASTEVDAIDILTTGTLGGIDIDTTDGVINISAVGATNGDLTITVGDNFTLTGVSTSEILIGNENAGLRNYEDTEVGTVDITATAAMSGRTFYLGTAGKDVTLPDAAAATNGVWYKFVVSANVATTNMIVTGPAADATDDDIFGAVTVAGALVACSAEDTLTFVADTNEAIEGDWVELRSNGTRWFISGDVTTALAFTCTDAD